jgi:hypothetical protein
VGTADSSDIHRAVLRRRREWFEMMTEAHVALWWIPRGTVPTVADAVECVRHLRGHGPTPDSFTLRSPFPAPGVTDATVPGQDWLCPV